MPFSAGQDQVRDVTVERQAGGRVYETWADGTELDWGELRAWEPPERFIMTWTGTPVPTEVEFTFTGLGPALTRVTVEHRGWEAMTDEQLAQDCALPGGYASGPTPPAGPAFWTVSPPRWPPRALRPTMPPAAALTGPAT